MEVEPGCEEAEDEDVNVIAENEEAEADTTAIGLLDVYYDSAFESDSDTWSFTDEDHPLQNSSQNDSVDSPE